MGYDVSYAEGQTLLYLRGAPVASRERGRPLTGVTVLLDPGHGGTDVGALGIGGGAGIAEKTINLTLALAVRDRLEQLGATVQMTRSTDETLTLQQRWRPRSSCARISSSRCITTARPWSKTPPVRRGLRPTTLSRAARSSPLRCSPRSRERPDARKMTRAGIIFT